MLCAPCGVWISDRPRSLPPRRRRPREAAAASALVSTNAECIKTHHNDTQLVRQLRDEGRILEPLADYHKDEVRELGVALGLPAEDALQQMHARLMAVRQRQAAPAWDTRVHGRSHSVR